MAWKKIPAEADYFHCEAGTDYFVCEEGLVVEGRYLQGDSVNLDKAIWPTVQGNRAYIRVRRKGVDKKFQLVRIFAELFPELLGAEVVIRTRKGAVPLRAEAESREPDEPARRSPPKVRKDKAPHRETVLEPEAESDLEPLVVVDEEDDEPGRVSADAKVCKVCNLRKRGSEFSPRDDMCLDCYLGRDELLKEIIARRRRKTKVVAPRVLEDNVDGNAMDDGLDNFGRMDFGISLPD